MERGVIRNWNTAHLIPLIRTEPRLQQGAWFAGVSVIVFLVPLVFSSWLQLHHDVYYLVYFAIVAAVLAMYVQASDISLTDLVARRWKLSLALGIASGAFVTLSVLGRIESTPHPSGAYFAFEILWRGIVYGVVDALLLSAFPGLIAWELMQRNIAGPAGGSAMGDSRSRSSRSSRRRTTPGTRICRTSPVLRSRRSATPSSPFR